MSKESKKKAVLSDHKKVGNRFIPPILQHTPIQELSWVDCTLPELIWIGLLNEIHGLKLGAELSLELAKAAIKVDRNSKGMWYGFTSAYVLLSDDKKKEVVRILDSSGRLDLISEALSSLVELYPECPLNFLFSDKTFKSHNQPTILQEFKHFLSEFFYKRDRIATLAQANATYIALVTGKLKIVKGVTGFDNFPAIADFPHTEESKRVAASLYATTNSLMSLFLEDNSYDKYTPWSRYFWNRGLQLERCTMKEMVQLYE